MKPTKLSDWATKLMASTPAEAGRLKVKYRQRHELGKNLASGFAIACPAFVIPGVAFLITPEPSYGPVIGVLCLAGLVGYIALTVWLGGFERRVLTVDQHLRDIAANEIHRKLAAGETAPPFSLYLRPFISTNDVHVPKAILEALSVQGPHVSDTGMGLTVTGPTSSPISVTVGTTPRQTELEGVLRVAVARRAPLICLGSRLEHTGAGRIEVTDEDWQVAVQRLITAAELIVVAPSKRAGTLWEIELILDSGLVDRCVFIDLPSPQQTRGKFDQDSEWRDIREAFARRGYDLPDNHDDGHFLYFGRQKSPLLGTPIGYLEQNRMAEFFAAVLEARGPASHPARASVA